MTDLWPANLSSAGPLMALASIFVGSFGVPLPTFAVLIFAGSVIGITPHALEVGSLMVLAGMACSLTGDIVWFSVGRRYGINILRMICRLSLSRDTCVRNTADLFASRGLYLLLFSRFLPGLSIVTSPLAGASGTSMRRFVLYDAAGAALWIGVGLTVGCAFAGQIAMLVGVLRHFGLDLTEAAVALIVVYISGKWIRRHQLIRQLQMARISVSQLNGLLDAQAAPLIIDARSALQQNVDPFRIPGALLLRKAELDRTLARLPKGHPIVVYCACPNEVSAAMMVKRMHKLGITNIHPLAGGLDAWRAAGLPVDPVLTMAPEPTAAAA